MDRGNDHLEKKLPENPEDEEAEDAMQLIFSGGMKLPYNIKFPDSVEDNDMDLDPADENSSHDEDLEEKISSVFDRPELFENEEPYCPPGYVYVKDSKKEEKSEDEDCREAGDIYELGCAVCGNMDHFNLCPWLQKIPPGGKLGPCFDIVCIGCGMLGRACCSKGGRAVLKQCGLCFVSGHWGDTCPSYKLKPCKGK